MAHVDAYYLIKEVLVNHGFIIYEGYYHNSLNWWRIVTKCQVAISPSWVFDLSTGYANVDQSILDINSTETSSHLRFCEVFRVNLREPNSLDEMVSLVQRLGTRTDD